MGENENAGGWERRDPTVRAWRYVWGVAAFIELVKADLDEIGASIRPAPPPYEHGRVLTVATDGRSIDLHVGSWLVIDEGGEVGCYSPVAFDATFKPKGEAVSLHPRSAVLTERAVNQIENNASRLTWNEWRRLWTAFEKARPQSSITVAVERVLRAAKSMPGDPGLSDGRLTELREALAIPPSDKAPEGQEVMAFIESLMLHNAKERETINQNLMDGLQINLDRARATLALIRLAVRDLANEPSVPNPMRFVEALHPLQRLVDAQVEKVEQIKREKNSIHDQSPGTSP